ncbi:MAG TPA: Si-specific NAD(P)(+) transhydrogenase [Gaiellales bacterium]|jgi:NAD(P) transhydrogenase|nr:Si-specific NAD(P)(+) transhydrogenase [Gaiellales bacterium]
MSDMRFDLVVLGSGPAGQKAAIQAAKVGASVCVVERRDTVGGVCANTGTIPSKTLREAAIYLTGLSERGLYGQSYRVKDEITIDDLIWRTQQVMAREVDVIRNQLARNHIRVIAGHGRFLDPHRIEISDSHSGVRTIEAERTVIATGTSPAHPSGVEFDEATILDSDGILDLSRIPSTLVVVGAGVIGIEYASIFAALGTRVTVVEQRQRLLEFCDGQVVEALQYHLRDLGLVFRLGETVTSVERHADNGTLTSLASGKRIAADAVMYSAGRQGATADLGLENAGLEADERGRVPVDEHYRTAVEHIYAVGDVIGFPSLASSSFEQGRLAAAHAFGVDARPMRELLPIGIYTIPEISFAGRTEEDLTGDNIPYEIGISRYRELARGQILGDQVGVLKLLVSPDDRTLLGVHAFGTAATELVHIGQTVMGLGGTVDYLIDLVFNYPTLAESYKVAALDATNKLRALNRLTV